MNYRLCERLKKKEEERNIYYKPDEVFWDILSDLERIDKDKLKIFYLRFALRKLKGIWDKYYTVRKNSKSRQKREKEEDANEYYFEQFSELIMSVEDLLNELSEMKSNKSGKEEKEKKEMAELISQRDKILWTGKKQDFAAFVVFLEESKQIAVPKNINKIYAETFYFKENNEIKTSTAKQIGDLKAKVKNPRSLIKTDEGVKRFLEKKRAELLPNKNRIKAE